MNAMKLFPQLPIVEHLGRITSGLRENKITLLQAPPGSGKTTILPLSLLNEPWLDGKRILILQPRRLAAKTVAFRMAELLGEPVGQTVGYQIRLERKVSSHTRIEVITEGLLTRRLVNDPDLPDVGLIIFDEFHERSIHADMGLALAREVVTTLRSDLRVVIMSATIQGLFQDESFSEAWRYNFEIPPFPVAIKYIIPEPRLLIWEQVARLVKTAIQQHQGDLLAFLPGASEIERCRSILLDSLKDVKIVPLYGELSYAEQQAALRPTSTGARKIVLATPIAETSITIEGVRIVVDSGLHKVARSSSAGAHSLTTERITVDSADQRAGRAGRTAPGVCLRLWSETDHQALRAAREPEVLRVDLTQPLLELAAWGIRDPLSFSWITKPTDAAIHEARGTLGRLGAVDSGGQITARGKLLVSLSTHPRLANLAIESRRYNIESYAAVLLALLEERLPDHLTAHSADISRIAEPLKDDRSRSNLPPRVADLARLWLRRIESIPKPRTLESSDLVLLSPFGFLTASAFPERLSKRRTSSRERYVMAVGRGVKLSVSDPLTEHEYIAVASLFERTDDSAVSLAAPINPKLFEGPLQHLVNERPRVEFDEDKGSLQACTVTSIGAVILREEPIRTLSPEDRQSALKTYLRTPEGMLKLPWSEACGEMRTRTEWARSRSNETLPDLSDVSLCNSEPFWLETVVPKDGKLSRITSSDVEKCLRDQFSWAAWQSLQSIAPETFALPNGKQRKLDYSSAEGPKLEALIQEVFGLRATPTIGSHRVLLTLCLLSPARRPMQVTRDLEGFWKASYPEIRKELRGRYPKHRWPEDPTSQG